MCCPQSGQVSGNLLRFVPRVQQQNGQMYVIGLIFSKVVCSNGSNGGDLVRSCFRSDCFMSAPLLLSEFEIYWKKMEVFITDCSDLIKILVSPIITVATFFFTYRLSLKNNRLTQENTREQARLSISPFIQIEVIDQTNEQRQLQLQLPTLYIESNKSNDLMHTDIIGTSEILKVTNVGQATAVDIGISVLKDTATGSIKFDSLGKNQIKESAFNLEGKANIPYILQITFSDLQGRKYYQKFQLILQREPRRIVGHSTIINLTPPELFP